MLSPATISRMVAAVDAAKSDRVRHTDSRPFFPAPHVAQRRLSTLRCGFTLIELLIVVAIVAVLAAIAVPNFLEAQVRSKVSRAKADMRSLATAVESYGTDNNRYPHTDPSALNPPIPFGTEYCNRTLCLLSTPVAYITTGMLVDVFNSGPVGAQTAYANYIGYANCREARPYLAMMGITPTQEQDARFLAHRWLLQSVGPDRQPFAMMNTPTQNFYLTFLALTDRSDLSYFYDATNGSVSTGDIVRSGLGQL